MFETQNLCALNQFCLTEIRIVIDRS